jgi:hypothetical protein
MVVIEYNCRGGCDIIFTELYHASLRAMHVAGVVQEMPLRDLGIGGLKWAPGYLSPEIVMREPRLVTYLSQESIKNMAAMMQSQYYDVKHNVAEAAAKLSAESHNQFPIANSSLGELLVQNLGSVIDEIRRACCTAVAHLASDKNAARILLKQGAGPRLVELIVQPFCRQSVREAARALSNLSQVADADLCDNKVKLRDAMERLKIVAECDERTAASLKSASPALREL